MLFIINKKQISRNLVENKSQSKTEKSVSVSIKYQNFFNRKKLEHTSTKKFMKKLLANLINILKL